MRSNEMIDEDLIARDNHIDNEQDFITFHMKNENIFKINCAVSINQITGECDNSILKMKINPNTGNEFGLVNSNFSLNYMVIAPDGVYNLGSFKEHTDRVNDIAFFRNISEPFNKAFFSGSADGEIKLWDSRAGSSVKTISTHGKGKVQSLDVSAEYLVAGYGNDIGMWDLKTMKQVGKCTFGHSEEVTCVRLRDELLLSGGEDNIVNYFDLKDGMNMNAVVATANINQSISSVDFLDDEVNYLQATTTVNTHNIINMANCQSIFEFDAKSEVYQTDYILDAFYAKEKNKIELFCGSYSGNIAVFTLDISGNEVKVDFSSLINSGRTQSFNTIAGLMNNSVFLIGSDEGNCYIVERKSEEEVIHDSSRMIEDELDIDSTNTSQKKNKKKRMQANNSFNPY